MEHGHLQEYLEPSETREALLDTIRWSAIVVVIGAVYLSMHWAGYWGPF